MFWRLTTSLFAKCTGRGRNRIRFVPTMPTVGEETKSPAPKKKQPTRTEAVRAAKATIPRRNSLRKQRKAQKG